MRPIALIPALAAALALCAGGAACKKAPVDPLKRHVLVRYRVAPGGVTKASPGKEFHCIAYTVEVVNRGYERIAFDRGAFLLEVDGKLLPAADPAACATAAVPPPASLDNGKSWKAVIAFEQPALTEASRLLFKPAAVKDGLLGRATSPVVDYTLSTGN